MNPLDVVVVVARTMISKDSISDLRDAFFSYL